ncbi:hypothetical protein [Pseudomonas sp. MH10]|uniref:hypothetical protein n=1 Tax=Pseudomonas sp. MH10 TaxID=3048627 RepID=UPI002B233CDC|nr:hypothetical protein [Pseudomonas sp. MH10]
MTVRPTVPMVIAGTTVTATEPRRRSAALPMLVRVALTIVLKITGARRLGLACFFGTTLDWQTRGFRLALLLLLYLALLLLLMLLLLHLLLALLVLLLMLLLLHLLLTLLILLLALLLLLLLVLLLLHLLLLLMLLLLLLLVLFLLLLLMLLLLLTTLRMATWVLVIITLPIIRVLCQHLNAGTQTQQTNTCDTPDARFHASLTVVQMPVNKTA